VDFGRLAQGAAVTQAVDASNTGTAPVDATVSVEGPFTIQSSTLALAAGETRAVQVTFAPGRAQAETGALVVAWLSQSVRVPLSGEGLPACASSTCQRASFDLVSRRCVETALADGVACETRCLLNGQCAAGRCTGAQRACDDGNACTVDACSEEVGCVHPDRACPSALCQLASCDPGSGCLLADEPDGRPCGASTCERASICLAGSCQVRSRPGANLSCRYSAVAAGTDFSCAVNLLGELRCWGGLSWVVDGAQPAWASPPTKVSAPAGLGSLSAAGYDVCALDGSGSVWCGRASRLPSGGVVLPPLSRLTINQDQHFALNSAGAGFYWPMTFLVGSVSDGFVVPMNLVAGAVDLATPGNLSGCEVLLLDGGVAGQVLAEPVLRLEPWAWGVHHITADGGVVHGGGSVDGRYCTVGLSGPVACSGGLLVTVPGTVTQLTGNGRDHVCALTSTGEVWCWGGNASGQLGETSARQLVPKELVASGAGDLVAGQTAVVVRVGDRLLGWGQGLIDLDGGLMGDGGVVTAALLGTAPGVTTLLATDWLLRDGGVRWCWGPGRALAECAPSPNPHGLINTCVLVADGGVDCGFPGQPNTRRVPFAGPATRVSVLSDGRSTLSGCAVLAGAEVRCFEVTTDGGVGVTAVPGLYPRVRDVVGGTWSGCALAGSNIVQCWGGNFYGQLGREGPSTVAALPITFPERVEQLVAGTDWAPMTSTPGGSELAQVCVRLASGRVLCWGSNRFGQLGPVLTSSAVPVRVEL
jgi:hypothetical protein